MSSYDGEIPPQLPMQILEVDKKMLNNEYDN